MTPVAEIAEARRRRLARATCEDMLGCAVECAREVEMSWLEFLAAAVRAWRTREF